MIGCTDFAFVPRLPDWSLCIVAVDALGGLAYPGCVTSILDCQHVFSNLNEVAMERSA